MEVVGVLFFAAFCGRCATCKPRKVTVEVMMEGQTVLVHKKLEFLLVLGDNSVFLVIL